MNGMMEGIFGIIILIGGIYSLYAWYQLKFTGKINTSILVTKDTNVNKCKDKKAYIAEAGPKLLVFAIAITLYGAVDLYSTYVKDVGVLSWIMIVVVLVVVVWFGYTSKKLREKYFG